MKQLNLPRKYKNEDNPDRVGKVYMSYSSHGSFSNPNNQEFFNQAVLRYIFGIDKVSRFEAYSAFGSAAGEYLEDKSKKDNALLNEEDNKFLDTLIDQIPDGGEYEREVWIDRGSYHILGFEDLWLEKVKGKSDVCDFKTGSIVKKEKDYADMSKYFQTRLYAYYEDVVLGREINACYAILLDRSGNAMADPPEELHLTGQLKKIETPYKREDVEKFLTKMDKTAKYVADLNTTFQSLNSIKISV
jgi:hypothetical protein